MTTYISNFLKDFVFSEDSSSNAIPGQEKRTLVEEMQIGGLCIPKYINEFWTSKQRQGSAIHQISYRACFKPQLPRFFINLLTEEEEVVYDPFCGRGTTIVEAALLGRRVISNDINPLSEVFSKPRLFVPSLSEVEARLGEIPLDQKRKADLDLSMFFYPDTEGEIVSLQSYLQGRKEDGKEDHVDSWIRMVSTNRLTGHSPGFFSVYTLPPNQAVLPERQKKINQKRNQQPVYRDTKKIILKKSHSLLKNLNSSEKEALHKASETAVFLQKDARDTSEVPDNSVQLTVTSPPFLDVVQYSMDNWLRCWFNKIDTTEIEKKITMAGTVEKWSLVMGSVFEELFRITKKGGWVAFEVGEVKNGKIRLDEYVISLGLRAGFACEGVIVNLQEFTKTSNIWGVSNNDRGTNTNRIVVFNKI
ncbi:MAG: DNA methyltransferase [Bacillota bacterium]|nr:DNA methyltransferase [Bacillota bacterium]